MAKIELDPNWKGWLEIVVGVSNVEEAAKPFLMAGQWKTLHSGAFSSAQKGAWGLEQSRDCHEQLIHVAETYGGYIRFVSFSGDDVEPVRPDNANVWDSGGIWLVNGRTKDIEADSPSFERAGLPSHRGVHAFDFDFLSVKEAIHSAPHGINFSMIQQIKPPIDPPEPYLGTSRVFNAALVCRDHSESRNFYVNKLGFKPWIETRWEPDNEGLNLVAPRDSFAQMSGMDVSIVSPNGDNFGSIELLTYQGEFEIADISDRAAPPALGNLLFRFYAEDLDARLQQFEEQSIDLVRPISTYELAPFGTIRSAIIKSPEGVWLEFFETV